MKNTKNLLILSFVFITLISCEKQHLEESKDDIMLSFTMLTDEGSKVLNFNETSEIMDFINSSEYKNHLRLVESLKLELKRNHGNKDFENDYLKCTLTEVEVADAFGHFIEHETCCSKVNGKVTSNCFEVLRYF